MTIIVFKLISLIKMDYDKTLYLQLQFNNSNIQVYQSLKESNFQEAIENSKTTISLAKRIKSESFELESTLNLALSLFFNGNFIESIEVFEACLRITNGIIEKNTTKDTILTILKAMSNLIMACIAASKISEAKAYVDMIFEKIDLLNENTLNERLCYIKALNFNFFGVENIEELINPTECDELTGVQKITSAFYSLAFKYDTDSFDREFDKWIELLKKESDGFKGSKDFHGFLFSNLNLNLGLVLRLIITKEKAEKTEKLEKGMIKESKDNEKDGNKNKELKFGKEVAKDINKEKNSCSIIASSSDDGKKERQKLKSFLKILVEEFNKDNVKADLKGNLKDSNKLVMNANEDDVALQFKAKLEITSKILKRLYSFEQEINSKLRDEQEQLKYQTELDAQAKDNLIKTTVIRIFVKFALAKMKSAEEKQEQSELGGQPNPLIPQLQLTLDLLDTEELDLSSLDLNLLDSDIFKSFKQLHRNLSLIKYKSVIKHHFKKLKKNCLGWVDAVELKNIRGQGFKNFSLVKLNNLRDGMNLWKINFRRSGKKTHFYSVCMDEGCVKIYEKAGAKTFTRLFFSDMIKFGFGETTNNMKKKLKDNFREEDITQANCFSLVTIDRTYDFICEENEVEDWFYGLKYVFKTKMIKCSICSVSYFRFSKLKINIVLQLKEIHDRIKLEVDSKSASEKTLSDLNMLSKILTHIKIFGYHSFSFLKLFVLVLRLRPLIK